MSNKLRILENDLSLFSDNTKNYEVYDIAYEGIIDAPPLFASDSLYKAVDFCYNLGYDFEVRTLSQTNREAKMNTNHEHYWDTPTKPNLVAECACGDELARGGE